MSSEKVDKELSGDASTDELVLSPADERRIKRRVNWAIVPYCTLLYLFNFLDRVNIGQAKLAGLEKDLHITDNQYDIALTLTFVAFVVVEIPFNIALRRWKPHRVIAVSMVLWGLITAVTGVVKGFGGLAAVRFLLGMAEGGLFPGVNMLLNHWYTRDETNWVVSIFFAGASLAGAWSGLLAYGIRHMAGDRGHDGWAWIFILEGVVTVLIALPAWWLVPDFPEDSKLLSPRDKELWIARIRRSQGFTAAPLPFSWRYVVAAFTNWRTYVYALLYLSASVPVYALALFTPSIIAGMGFSNANANLLSVPPYAFSFIVTLINAYVSDRMRMRGPFLIFFFTIVIIGYAILISHVSVGVRYFALHLAVGGTSPCIATSITWIGNNVGPTWSRAAAMGIFFTIGISGGIFASNIYPAKQGPRFVRGNATVLAFAALGIVCATVLMLAYRAENARRDKEYGAVTNGKVAEADGAPVDFLDRKRWKLGELSDEQIIELGDRHPAYRYML